MASSRRRGVALLILGIVVLVAAGAAGAWYMNRGESDGAAVAEGAAAGDAAVAQAKTGGDSDEKKAPIPVNVASVTSGNISSYISTTANLAAEDDVKVLSEVEGRIGQILVEEGDWVKGGQTLAILVRDDAEIALNKAALKEANTRLAQERATRALDEQLMSRQDFDKATMDHEMARQEKAEAEWRLEKTTIRAPFAGRVTARAVTTGQHIRPADHLFNVTDFDPLIARIYLPEQEIAGLREGQPVRITLKAEENVRCTARIRQISPIVDPATGTVKVTVEASAAQASLRPGSFVTVEIVRETRERALLLPREAVVRDMGDAFVFVAKGEKAEKRSIALGLEEAGQVEAVSGLAAGDQVIVAGQGGLKEGQSIKIVPPTATSSKIGPDASDLRG